MVVYGDLQWYKVKQHLNRIYLPYCTQLLALVVQQTRLFN